jgi:protein-disulfide isomerase
VRLVFRHLPLFQIRGHQFSRALAAASEMAAERGKFWAFADAAFNRPGLDRAHILALMKRLGFEPAAVEARLGDPKEPAIARVLRDEGLAGRLQINQTPTFIVLARGRPPVSANQRILARLLNSGFR